MSDPNTGEAAAVQGTTQPSTPNANQPGAASGPGDTALIAAQVRDAVFAELRRAGAFKKEAPPPAATPAAAPVQPEATTQPDAIRLRTLDRALMRAGVSNIPDAHLQRMERAFLEENPSDPAAWVNDYVGPFRGGAIEQTNNATAAARAIVSDTGAPAATQSIPSQANPLRRTADQVAADIRQKGMVRTGFDHREALRQYLRGQRLSKG